MEVVRRQRGRTAPATADLALTHVGLIRCATDLNRHRRGTAPGLDLQHEDVWGAGPRLVGGGLLLRRSWSAGWLCSHGHGGGGRSDGRLGRLAAAELGRWQRQCSVWIPGQRPWRVAAGEARASSGGMAWCSPCPRRICDGDLFADWFGSETVTSARDPSRRLSRLGEAGWEPSS